MKYDVGDRIGSYQLLYLCGEGAYGRVFLARNVLTQHQVALKLLPLSAKVTARELQGLKNYRECRHPNLLQIHHIDQAEGVLYYTMDAADNLAGTGGGYEPDTLAARLAHRKSLPAGEVAKMAAELLEGKNGEVKRRLEEQMTAYAEEERYEAAAKCRDTLRALGAIREKQKVVASPDTEQDVVALYSDDLCTCVSVFFIRGGVLHDTQEMICGAEGIPEPEDMTAFLTDFYRSRAYIPSEILIGFEMADEDCDLLSDSLSALAERRIHVRVPERGTKHTLCELVRKNAAEKARQYEAETGQKESILADLAQKLGLEVLPERIEAYEISNLGTEHLTAGMIVSVNGVFRKSDYRSFRIRTVEGTDDYASMREALSRRLAHLSDSSGSFSERPDLILLDGGRGHVSVVRDLLAELGLDIPVFGMVKDDFHKTRALCTDTDEISIAKDRGLFTMIYKIQEEVHRYTVRCMEQAKLRTLTTSALTAVPGIGEAKAKKLLLAFDGLAALRSADVTALKAVAGISAKDAEAVYAYYHPNEEKSEDSAPSAAPN